MESTLSEVFVTSCVIHVHAADGGYESSVQKLPGSVHLARFASGEEEAMQKQQIFSQPEMPAFGSHWERRLWSRWVLANLMGEFVGLGVAGTLGAAVTLAFGSVAGISTRIMMVLALIVAASVEGTAVGLAQWWVLRHYLPALTWRAWVLATMLGAIVAWMVGMVLGTAGGALFGSGESAAALVIGVALGPVVGALFGLFQWLALRRHVQNAIWWVLANAVAWTAGMILIFVATGIVQENTPMVVVAATWAVSGILAGVVVAAIHGLILVRLLQTHLPASSTWQEE
jgi:hypothetical protein